MQKSRLVTILGPTASGKTELAVTLAEKFNGAIISGDAFQVYRGMDIGTAKATMEERNGIPHYLIDILDPAETWSAAVFQEKAEEAAKDIEKQGKLPILAGGTGLYIQGLLEGFEFRPKVKGREKWETLYREEGMEGLRKAIRHLSASAEIPKDPQRSIRLLELLENNQNATAGKADELIYDGPVIGLYMDRALLYERINRRVDIMFDEGLVEEVKCLLSEGVPEDAQAFKGIGYKEIIPALRGEITMEEARSLIKKNTRHFAKRQLTWYRKMPYIQWVNREDKDWKEQAEQIVRDYWD